MQFDVTGQMGKDGFIWFVGVVEDRMDPKHMGRVRVRCLGWHNPLTDEDEGIPTEDLPWACIMQPVTSTAISGMGISPGLVEGTWVVGFFRDGDSAQEPIVMGTLPGRPEDVDHELEGDGFTDQRSDKEKFKGQLTLKESPRKIEEVDTEEIHRGNGLKWKEENEGTMSEEYGDPPPSDGKGSIYPRKENPCGPIKAQEDSNYEDERYNDISLLATNTDKTVSDVIGSSSPIGRKFFVIDRNIPIALTQWPQKDKPKWKEDKHKKVIVKIPPANKRLLEAKGWITEDDFICRSEYFWNEPETKYEAVYPFNNVYESESGHIFEIDDTPARERLHWMHRVGTFIEMHPNGDCVTKIMGSDYKVVLRDENIHIEGGSRITVDKGCKILVNADLKDGEIGNYEIAVGAQGNLNIHMETGDVNFLLKHGDFKTLVQNGDVEFNVERGDFRVNLKQGDFQVAWTKLQDSDDDEAFGGFNIDQTACEYEGTRSRIKYKPNEEDPCSPIEVTEEKELKSGFDIDCRTHYHLNVWDGDYIHHLIKMADEEGNVLDPTTRNIYMFTSMADGTDDKIFLNSEMGEDHEIETEYCDQFGYDFPDLWRCDDEEGEDE